MKNNNGLLRTSGVALSSLGALMLAGNALAMSRVGQFNGMTTFLAPGLLLGGLSMLLVGARWWWLSAVNGALGLGLGVLLMLEWNSRSPSAHPLVLMLVGN